MTEKELFAKYGIELERLRNELVNNISNKGINVSSTATLQQLVPLVNDVSGISPIALTSDKIEEDIGISLSNITKYENDNVVIVNERAFNYANNCSYIDLPNALQLNDLAFGYYNYSSSNVSINMPNIEALGYKVFCSAYGIKNWLEKNNGVIFENLITINSGAFMSMLSVSNCTFSFPKIKSLPNNCFDSCILGTKNILNFPETTVIYNNAFASMGLNSSLSINLPKLSTIGSYAFVYMLNSTNALYFSVDTIKTIYSNAFMSCNCAIGIVGENINDLYGNTISVFNNITIIPVNCFYGYSTNHNQSIEFMNVNTIGSSAFCYTKFTNISFNHDKPVTIYPNAFKSAVSPINDLTMKIVYRDAFYNANLDSAYIYSTSSISGTLYSSAFRNATSLKTVSGYIKTIGSSTFYNCSNLNALYLYNISKDITPLTVSAYNAFGGTPIYNGLGSIYVPASLYETYISATNWATLSNAFVSVSDM